MAYARRGWSVFPPRGKAPLIRRSDGGRGVPDAASNLGQIRDGWTRWPDADIGPATGGPSGFWVLDVDPPMGGEATLEALQDEHGPLPVTPERITGAGGGHLLFAYRGEPVRNRAGRPGPGLDVRALAGNSVDAVIALAAGACQVVNAELRRASGRGDGGCS